MSINTISDAVDSVLATHTTGRGRKPILGEATVISRYANGQPSRYLVDGRELTRRQYHVLVAALQEGGTLGPRKPRTKK